MNRPYTIPAVWPAPAGVSVFHTVRWGGVSLPPYDTWNLGDHVHDDPTRVRQNRARLGKLNAYEGKYQWLKQTHSIKVVKPQNDVNAMVPEADGIFLSEPGHCAVVLTADCLSVVLAQRNGKAAAVVHAGWRGLANGILAQAHALFTRGDALQAWIGPCISPQRFEVGDEVRAQFLASVPGAATAFLPQSNGKWQGMLSRLAYLALQNLGLEAIYGFGITHPLPDTQVFSPFFSHRRASPTGRFATVLSISI